MADNYSENNYFRIYAEKAKQSSEDNTGEYGTIYPAANWIDALERSSGAMTGIADSTEFNTVLRQATIGSTLLAEIIAQRYGKKMSSDLSDLSEYDDYVNFITTIASLFNKNNFLHEGEVQTDHIADANITTSKIADANITTSKIADANITTSKIMGNAVTTSKIGNSAVTKEKLAADVTYGTFPNMIVGFLLADTDDNSATIYCRDDSGTTHQLQFLF